MNKLRVFVTGASGYVGSLLLERLAQSPDVESITGIALTMPRSRLQAKVKFIQMDIRSDDLTKVMAGHDVVVHTACIVLWPASMPEKERDDINLNGVRIVGQAALANKVRRFVHASSMAAYDPVLVKGKTDVKEDFPLGKENSPYYYWNAKAGAERILTQVLGSSTVLTFLRPIYIIGPRNQAVIASYRQNAVKFLGQNPRRQFVHEEDVAAAFVQAVHTDMPGAFNVASDDFMQLNDVWKTVGAKFVPTIPLWAARLVTKIRWRYFGSPVHPSWVEDMLVDLAGSNTKLKSAGWTPRYNSAEALRSAVS
jgi:nucleoside-diphosphate-sugar epimerase